MKDCLTRITPVNLVEKFMRRKYILPEDKYKSNLRALQSILRRGYYDLGIFCWIDYQQGLKRIREGLDLIV